MGKTPKSPDPYQVANAQTQANNQAAQYNAWIGNANEINPYGSLTTTQIGQHPIYGEGGKITGYAPQFQRNIQLNPEQQQLLDYQNRTMANIGQLGVSQSARMQDLLGKPLDISGATPWATYGAAPQLNANAFRQDVAPTDKKAIQDAMMASYARYANPANEAQNTQLAVQGMSAGTPGYGTVQQTQQDALAEATRQAFLGAGEESRRAEGQFNQAQQLKNQATLANWQNAMARADKLNQLRGAQVSETIGLREQPIREIMSLLGMAGPTTPQFAGFNAPSTQPADIGNYIYQSNAMDQQAAQARMQGMFGLGGAALGLLTAPLGGAGSMFGNTLLGSWMGR